MKSLIIDADALKTISPSSLSAYARKLRWVRQSPYREFADIYGQPDLGLEAVFPKTSQVGDYPTLVSNLIALFAEQLGRDQEDVFRRLVDVENDVYRIRAADADEDGTISIDSGVELIAHSREAVLAAACAANSFQPVFRAGANREANEFIRTVRLGQTDQGSFVVNLLNRVPPSLQPSLLDEWGPIDEEPLERKVSRIFSNALRHLRTAAEDATGGSGWESFETAVQHGISANLCEAVAKMIKSSEDLDISVEWAETRPAPEESTRVKFSSDDEPILREAARALKAKKPRPDAKVFGVVSHLTRPQYEDDGTVRLQADVDGTMQSVSANLDQEDYTKAIRAHDNKFPVIVTGDLERKGERWHMINASIQVLETDTMLDDAERQGQD